MRPEDKIRNLINTSDVTTGPETDRKILGDALGHLEKLKKPGRAGTQPDKWRTIMKTKKARFAAAAVVALVVIGGITLWPGRGTDGKKWWLAPHAAWSQEIIDSLDTFKCVTCREQLIALRPDGSERTLAWMKKYATSDRYRRDWYNKGFLEQIQWYVPDGSDMIQHTIRFDSESYSIGRRTGVVSPGSKGDPVKGMRICVEDLDNADRLLGTEVIEGSECVGFEIDKQVGSTRIWFDVETKLPVRIEHRNQPKSPGSEKRITIIRDQYDYDPGLPPETFVPYIPEGFVPYLHPDDMQIDIAITDENLTVTEQPDGSFRAEIAIYNNGSHPCPKFEVDFYAGDPDKGGRLLAPQVAGPIPPGDYILSNHTGLRLRTNENTISVVVDPRNIVAELNETNNKAIAVITGRQPKKPDEADKSVISPAPAKSANSDESKVPAELVGTWFFDNPRGHDEQMAIFPDGRVVALYSNGHKDQTNIVDGSMELAEWNNAKCKMTIQEAGSLVQYFDLGAVSKRWNRIAPEPHTNLLRILDH